jgi:hypothetical protein
MKKLVPLFYLTIFLGISNAQQASEYFPSATGFEWKYKVTPLDSVSNPVNSLVEFRIDSFASVANYEGQLSNIIETKSGPLQTIQQQQYSDSLFYYTNGTDGFEYLRTKNIEDFLIALDETGTISNFSFLDFFTSLQNWYSTYRFASPVNTEYTIVQKDTTIFISPFNLPLQFKYLGNRLSDENLQTVLGNFDCKKFLLQWKVSASIFGDLLTLNDTIWIAPGNWIVQDIMPGQYVDNLTVLGIDPFAIPGLETKLTDELLGIEDEQQIPASAYLEQNYPNPFNPSTKIIWQSLVGSQQTLKVYDVLGNEVAVLIDEYKPAGRYEVDFNASSIPSGVYFYELTAGKFKQTRKMILMK